MYQGDILNAEHAIRQFCIVYTKKFFWSNIVKVIPWNTNNLCEDIAYGLPQSNMIWNIFYNVKQI